MCEKQNDIKHKETRFSESDDSESDNGGLIISKPVAVGLAFLLVLIVIAAVLITYFLPTCPHNVNQKSSMCETETGTPPGSAFPIPFQEETSELPPFDGRLPTTLKPITYRVKIRPYIDDQDGDKQFTFEGELSFTFDCVEVTDLITLHANGLHIIFDTVRLRRSDSHNVAILDMTYKQENYHFVTFKTESPLQINTTYTITLAYNASIETRLNIGIYSVNYTDNGKQRYLLATQLQPNYARRVFPCMDEPGFKATFNIAVTHRKTRQAFGNMGVIRTEHLEDGWVTSYFDTSVYMSTYLVAIVVADFECIGQVTDKGIEFRVCCTPEKVGTLPYSLDIGTRLLSHFEDLFQMPYILPKMDMLAIPAPIPAMENWGLVLYGEKNMLYNESVDSLTDKIEVSMIIVHEIAHQWFGNIVTCSWWSNLWLNEGLARYLEGVGINFIHKEWEFLERHYVKDIDRAKNDDSKSRHSKPVIRPGIGWNLENMFDRITYTKSSALVKMIERILGYDIFFDGLRHYLHKHKYSSVTTSDFFEALNEKAEEHGLRIDIAEIMEPWVRQAGHPFITVTRQGDQVHIDQKLFLLHKKDKPKEKYTHMGYKWNIPVTYTSEEELDFDNGRTEMMHMGPGQFQLPPDVSEDHWLIVNTRAYGFYLVNYDIDNWDKLAQQLKTNHSVIPVSNRGALINDAFLLNKAHIQSGLVGLKLLEYLEKETEYYPWSCALRSSFYMQDMLGNTPTYWYLKQFLKKIVRPMFNSITLDINSITEFQYQIYEIACRIGLPECVSHASSLFSQLSSEDDSTDNNDRIYSKVYRMLMLCTAIRYGDAEEWDIFFQRAQDDEENRYHLYGILSCSRDPSALQRLLEYGLDVDNFSYMFRLVAGGGTLGLSTARDFLFENFERIFERMNTSAYSLTWHLAESLNKRQHLAQLESFARSHSDMPGSDAREYYTQIEVLKTNIEWMDQYHQDIHDWLKDVTGHSYNTTGRSHNMPF